MRDPGAVMAGLHLAQLILTNLFKRFLVALRIILDGNLSRHSAHGVNAAPVTGLDQKVDIRLQKVAVHGDVGAIRQKKIGPVAELFDETENVIPAAAVESRRVRAKLI